MNKRYDITQCALYKCSNKKRLEHLLLLEPKELNRITDYIKYYSFDIPKKDGTNRNITAPNVKLKKIQKRVLRLLSYVIKPDWLISSQKGKSYIDNGKVHQKSLFCLTMDIKSFYPNCSREYVYQFFLKRLQTSPDIAAILTNIVTFQQQIPTGCPTSQIIAYYAYEEMFDEINSIALNNNCIFTLYVDDMTFSSNKSFDPHKIRDAINLILRKYGHKLKISKTKYYRPNMYKLITGVAVSPDNELYASNNLRNKIVTNFKQCKKEDFNDEKLIVTLNGQLQAAKLVNENIFPEVRKIVRRNIKKDMQ